MKAKLTKPSESFWAGCFWATREMLYEPGEGRFYLYDETTGLFGETSVDLIKQRVSSLLLSASQTSDPKMDWSGLSSCRTNSMLNAIVAQLRGIAECRGAFDDRPSVIHAGNCMLEIGPGGFLIKHEFSPEFMSRNRTPIAYDASAKCPRFEDELIGSALDADDAKLVQKYAGQLILGRNPTHRLLILDGAAGRGKSTLINVLSKMIGQANVTQLRTDLLTERFEIGRFAGKTLLNGPDVKPDFLNTRGAAVLKSLVGGDCLSAEIKGSNERSSVKGDFNVIISSNAKLRVKLAGDSDAWRRRLLIVRYESPPPGRKVPNFDELLIRDEGPGILNWCIQGARMLQGDLAAFGDVKLTETQQGRIAALLSESESLGHFLTHRIRTASGQSLTVEEITEEYSRYCLDMGWEPERSAEVHRQLPDLMLSMFRASKVNDITRDGKARKGFRHVDILAESDASDG